MLFAAGGGTVSVWSADAARVTTYRDSRDGRSALVATGRRGTIFIAPDWSGRPRLWWFPPGSDAPILNVIPDGVDLAVAAWSDTGELALVGPQGRRWLWSPSTP